MAALTPCQIGKILLNMARPGSIQRNITEERWCTLDTSATITVTDSLSLECGYDCEGNMIIKSGGVLEITCRLSMPEGSTITIMPGGKLTIKSTGYIHNACGDTWEGIVLVQEKKVKGILEVIDGGKIEDAKHTRVSEP